MIRLAAAIAAGLLAAIPSAFAELQQSYPDRYTVTFQISEDSGPPVLAQGPGEIGEAARITLATTPGLQVTYRLSRPPLQAVFGEMLDGMPDGTDTAELIGLEARIAYPGARLGSPERWVVVSEPHLLMRASEPRASVKVEPKGLPIRAGDGEVAWLSIEFALMPDR